LLPKLSEVTLLRLILIITSILLGSLLAFVGFLRNEKANLRLCQQFIAYNPSQLPSPAELVTVNRIRVTDSYTHLTLKQLCPQLENETILSICVSSYA